MAVEYRTLQRRGREGHEALYQKNHESPYTGWVKVTFPNGQAEELCYVKDGYKRGLATKWYENGQKQGGVNFKDGKQELP